MTLHGGNILGTVLNDRCNFILLLSSKKQSFDTNCKQYGFVYFTLPVKGLRHQESLSFPITSDIAFIMILIFSISTGRKLIHWFL